MKSYIEVTYRDIAKMLASALPVEGQDFRLAVDNYLETIKSLPKEAKLALKTAYVFSRKVPREEREDIYQDLVLAVLKVKTGDEKLAYTVARFDWLNWWKRYSIRQHYSLDAVIEDDEGNPATLGELIVGEVEFERKMDGKLDAERIYNSLPERIKAIVMKRLLGQALNNNERFNLHYWVKTQGYKILMHS